VNETQKLKNTTQERNTNMLNESTQELADLALRLLRDVSQMRRIEAAALWCSRVSVLLVTRSRAPPLHSPNH
jgi:flagellar biosynthesis/type III secretory pathway protein FliH